MSLYVTYARATIPSPFLFWLYYVIVALGLVGLLLSATVECAHLRLLPSDETSAIIFSRLLASDELKHQPRPAATDVALDGPSTVEDWGWLESTEATAMMKEHQRKASSAVVDATSEEIAPGLDAYDMWQTTDREYITLNNSLRFHLALEHTVLAPGNKELSCHNSRGAWYGNDTADAASPVLGLAQVSSQALFGNKSKPLHKFGKHVVDTIPLHKLVDLCNVSLDEPIDNHWGVSANLENKTLRYHGAQLVLNIHYSNLWHRFQSIQTLLAPGEVEYRYSCRRLGGVGAQLIKSHGTTAEPSPLQHASKHHEEMDDGVDGPEQFRIVDVRYGLRIHIVVTTSVAELTLSSVLYFLIGISTLVTLATACCEALVDLMHDFRRFSYVVSSAVEDAMSSEDEKAKDAVRDKAKSDKAKSKAE